MSEEEFETHMENMLNAGFYAFLGEVEDSFPGTDISLHDEWFRLKEKLKTDIRRGVWLKEEKE